MIILYTYSENEWNKLLNNSLEYFTNITIEMISSIYRNAWHEQYGL